MGLVGSFSGRYGILGVTSAQGSILALEERNARGGVRGDKVRVLLGDDGGRPDRAASVDQTLLDRGVRVFLGHTITQTTAAVLPLLNRSGCLLLSATVSSPVLSGKEDALIRIVPGSTGAASDLARVGLRRGLRRVACVWDRGDAVYALPWQEDFFRELRQGGGTPLACLSFLKDEKTSFDDLAREILRPQTDGVLLVARPLDTALLAQRLRLQGYRGGILCATWGVGPELIPYGGRGVEGLLSVHLAHPQGRTREGDFPRRFQDRFGVPPSWASRMGYEAASVLLEGLEAVGENPLALRRWMVNRTYRGLEGPFSVDRFGDGERATRVFELRDGVFREVHP